MIVVNELEKTFITHQGTPVRAVNGLSFRIERGRVFGLLGPNGAGKTTTLRMLAGLMTPTAGRIELQLQGKNEAALESKVAVDLAQGILEPMLLKQHIGFLTANTGLYARLSPREILIYFGELRGLPSTEVARQAQELIELLGIEEFADRRCEGLSTGQRQRVQIARTLVGNPPILILDEPTLGLDVLSNQLILNFIVEAARGGRTIVLSTHHLDEVEEICDTFCLLHEGRVMAEGSLQQLREASGEQRLSKIFRALVRRASEPGLATSVAEALTQNGLTDDDALAFSQTEEHS